jgi:endonuclease/exonuclease/phosphatase family metal-dependent hydrolase
MRPEASMNPNSAMMRMSMKLRTVLFALLLVSLAGTAAAQTYDTLRLCTYNVLNYPPSDTSKNADYRDVLHAINPDLLVVQEMNSSAGATAFLNNVLNAGQPGTYSMATYSTDSSDNAMYYKSSLLTYISPVQIIHTEPRHINGFRLRPVGISSDSIDIQIYSMHLKASTGSDNELRRAEEAESLRTRLNSLPDGGFFIGTGDLNLYASSEDAWANLTESRADNSGRLYDPINRVGSWSDNSSYADVHTQSTRTESLTDGGATGGLDDRFDFMLLSYTYQNSGGWDYVSGSYTEYGNDGNHLNQAINEGTNSAVPENIADALYYASDHLPVFLELRRQITPPASITLLSPNGSELFYTGTSYNITWSSQSLTGTVTLRLNRSYPSTSWDTLVTGTANDGSYSWTATGPATTTARVQVISDVQSSVRDSSNANFEIRLATIALQSPIGGESWAIGELDSIFWASAGVQGNVTIELNRSFPSGGWETLFTNTANDGAEPWTVTSPVTASARIRIYAVSYPNARDSSDANFAIVHTDPPTLTHDPHGDGMPGWVRFTARAADDAAGLSVLLFYREPLSSFDYIAMSLTGNPNEYADSLYLDNGRYEYFIRATDAESQSVETDTFTFVLSEYATGAIGYDDGTAELFNWSEDDSFAWAVRFTPPQTPFNIGEVTVGVAGFHPDTVHSVIRIKIYSADGAGNMPGTLLREVVRGSVGNIIGGLPAAGMYTTTVILHDNETEPLTVTGDFYVAVENTTSGFEAFAMDTSSSNVGRSVVYDPCEEGWFEENGVHANSRDGNRIVRVRGWFGAPPELVIRISGTDVLLNWQSTGAPYYKLYRLSDFGGTTTYITSTVDTSYIAIGAISADAKMFYFITSSSQP